MPVPTSRTRRGFSLVELAVVLIVVAVIAAIAIPTYSTVVRRASAQVTERSLATVVAQAWVLAAYDGEPGYTVGLLEQAAGDTTSGGEPWTVITGGAAASTEHGQISVELADDGNAVAASMRDRDGGCSFLLGWRGAAPQLWSVGSSTGAECSAAEAMFGPPEPEAPLVTVPG